MKHVILILAFFFQMAWSQGGFDKVGTTSFQFLKVIPDARSSALGNAYTSVKGGAEVIFWNPASLAEVEGISASVAHLDWLLDVTQSAVAISYEVETLGVFGFHAMINDIGDIYITDPTLAGRDPVSGEFNPGLTADTYSPSSQVYGFSFARTVTDKFSFGLTMKYAIEDLYVEEASAVIFDAGISYNTGYKSLRLAASLLNFGGEVKFGDKAYPLPQVLAIGVSGNVFGGEGAFVEGSDMHNVLLAFDLVQTRDHSQQQLAGLEYNWNEILYLRGGYKFNFDIESYSLGAGIRYQSYSIDYSFNDMDTFFDAVHRFSVGFNWK